MHPAPIPYQYRALRSDKADLLDTHIIVTYRMSASPGLSLEEAAAKVLLITSQRTMLPLHYEKHFQELGPKVVGAYMPVQEPQQTAALIDIAYPLSLCTEREGLTQVLLVLTAAVDYKYTNEFWVEDVVFPRLFVERFSGPRFGVRGLRDWFGVEDRPLLGLVLKPRTGVSLSTIQRIARQALENGADLILDDLMLIDPSGELGFQSRVGCLAEVAATAESTTGECKRYLCNIASSPLAAMAYGDRAIELGAGGVMVNCITMGFGAVADVVNSLDGKLPVVSTNLGSGLLSRQPVDQGREVVGSGMSETVVVKLSRLAGADAVHTGTEGSECYGEVNWSNARHALESGLPGLLPAFAVAEGDLTVGNVWDNVMSLGIDSIVEPTSGMINFPGGVARGAHAFRELLVRLKPTMTPDQARHAIMVLGRRDRHLREALTAVGFDS